MRSSRPYCVALALSLMGILLASTGLLAQGNGHKVALVLGNGAYTKIQALRNPANDASDMAAALVRMGFTVLSKTDLDRRAMRGLVDDFNKAIQGAEVAFFFYSGHGVQIDGENYLVPVNAEVSVPGDVPDECVSLSRITARMSEAGAGTNVVILDACRDNPFKAVSRGIERGLAVVGRKPPESIIVYATAENEKADDGNGRNGVFTAALLKNIERPDSFADVLLDVKAQVRRDTSEKQKPATYENLSHRVYLTGGQGSGQAAAPTPSATPPAAKPTLSVTRSYGVLMISAATAGTLYLDGVAMGELPAGAEAKLDNIEVGDRVVELRYDGGYKETKSASLQKGQSSSISFTWKKAAPQATSPTIDRSKIKSPESFVFASSGDVQTLDPAAAYDNASQGALALVYDRLIDFDGVALGKFRPMLATEVPTVANGGISKDGLSYTFRIRPNVKFHDGSILTPEDVAYSIKRNMVTDPDGGPDWIWFKLFFGTNGSRGFDGKLSARFADIDRAIQVTGNAVVFKLARPFAPFLSILAGKWASIVSKKWVISQGGWNGTEATWARFNNPNSGSETLWAKAMGTGPYKLVRWDKNKQYALERNDAYWGPKPAIKNAIRKVVDDWGARKLLLVSGDADCVEVYEGNYSEMEGEKGLAVYRGLLSLDISGILFNLKINTLGNAAIYSGALDGQGIPSDFFSDVNVRLGFVYAWDERAFLDTGLSGNAIDPVTPFPVGLPYKNTSIVSRPLDLAKAAEYLRKAWGGKVWEKGFKFDLIYNNGNFAREIAAKIFARNLSTINPKFQVLIRNVEWAKFVDMRRSKQCPVFYGAWSPDYPDPENYIDAFMDSKGMHSGPQGYNNPEVDRLAVAAGAELDPAKRQADYYALQDIWQRDSIAILTHQRAVNRYFKDWIKGYYYNPMETEQIERLPDLYK